MNATHQALINMRNTAAVALQVLAKHGLEREFVEAALAAGVPNGVGVDCDHALDAFSRADHAPAMVAETREWIAKWGHRRDDGAFEAEALRGLARLASTIEALHLKAADGRP